MSVLLTHLITKGEFFFDQKLMLSCSFRCGQIHYIGNLEFWPHFAVLLKSDLDVQPNQPLPFRGWFVEQMLIHSSSFRCYQIHNTGRLEFGHTVLFYLSLTWMFNKPPPQWLFVCWTRAHTSAPASGVTEFIIRHLWIWPHFAMLLKSDLDVQQTYLRDCFVEQMLMPSSSFRCGQIYNIGTLEFGPHFAVLLKSDLDVQQSPASGIVCLLNKCSCLSSSLSCNWNHHKNLWIWPHFALLLKSDLYVQQAPASETVLNKCSCLAPALGVTEFII